MYKRTIKNEPNNIKLIKERKTQEFYRQKKNHDDKKYKIKVNRNKKKIDLFGHLQKKKPNNFLLTCFRPLCTVKFYISLQSIDR